MIDYIITAIIILIIVAFGFYLGTLVGSDKQAAMDQRIVDQYDKMVNERDLKIRNLELKIKRIEESKNE